MHALWKLGNKQGKTIEEKMLLVAIFTLMSKTGFTDMTPEQVYNWLNEGTGAYNLD